MSKILQPFFNTKPTGQVTGFGLTLSYDIIKAHGVELKVKTEEGEFAEFVITLQFESFMKLFFILLLLLTSVLQQTHGQENGAYILMNMVFFRDCEETR